MPRKKKASDRNESADEGTLNAGALFPPRLEDMAGLTESQRDASAEDAYARLLETICGATDDSQPVEQYDGSLGVTRAFVDAHQRPAAQIQWNTNLASIYTSPGNVADARWCTGTMISSDLFLTAGHCFDQTGGGWTRPKDNSTGATIPPSEIATNMHINFDYQVDSSGNLRTEQSFAVSELVEYRLGGLDFAIVRISGNPGNTFGTTTVSTTDASTGDVACIIGHPAGMPKRIEAGPITDLHGTWIGYNDIDTLGGNSGSGILQASSGRIVGVHTNGGCGSSDPDSDTSHNHGVRISSILAQSPTLQTLTQPTNVILDSNVTSKAVDDGPLTLKFFDDGGGTLKFLEDGGTLKFIEDGGTLKSVDDVKLPGLDKQFGDHKIPGSDGGPFGGGSFRPGGGFQAQPSAGGAGGVRPFVLSTPHHSMNWATGAMAPAAAAERQAAAQYEAALTQLVQLIQHGAAELQALQREYERLVAEYQALTSGQNR